MALSGAAEQQQQQQHNDAPRRGRLSLEEGVISPMSSCMSLEFHSSALPPAAPLQRRAADELARLGRMAGPLCAQNLLAYSTTVVAIGAVGHLNDPQLLSAVVLANSLYNVTGASVVSGLASGMEALCGQAFGARAFKTLGLILQRALLITWLTCVAIHVLWLHSEQLLLMLGQSPAIAAGAATYLRLIAPTLYFGAAVECCKRYLLAQRCVLPGMAVTGVTVVLAPLYNWVLIFKLSLGLRGAALAFVLSQGTTCLLLAGYVLWRDVSAAAAGDPQATWPRPGVASLAGWGQFLSMGLPGAVMICVEWWLYEIVIFMAGILANAELALGVMGVCFQLSACAYMAALAFGSTVNTRVSNELGAGQAEAARMAVVVGVGAVSLLELLVAGATAACAHAVVALLSNSAPVQALVLSVLPVLLPTFIGDAINAVCQGVLRGAGRPGIGALLCVGYWIFGLPLAALLGLHLGWGVFGFWTALLATTFTQAFFQLAVISRLDWNVEVQRAALLNASHEAAAADAKDGPCADAEAADTQPVRDRPGRSRLGAAAARPADQPARRSWKLWWRREQPQAAQPAAGPAPPQPEERAPLLAAVSINRPLLQASSASLEAAGSLESAPST